MAQLEQTWDGKLLPRHLKMFRDEMSGRIELRYWRFHPILIFLIPFFSVWSGVSLFGCYVLPFIKGGGGHVAEYAPCFFGIPFLVVSIVAWGWILTMLFGRSRLVLEYGHGCYSRKLWSIGRKRQFDLRFDTEVKDGRQERPMGMKVQPAIASASAWGRIRIKNGYRSEMICSFWDDDAVDFTLELLNRFRA